MSAEYYIPKPEEIRIGETYEIHTMTTGGLVMMSTNGTETVCEPHIAVWETVTCGPDAPYLWGYTRKDLLKFLERGGLRKLKPVIC
jgi:hypothetical protein